MGLLEISITDFNDIFKVLNQKIFIN